MDIVSEAILEVSREIFSTLYRSFLLSNNAMQTGFWSVFKVVEQVSIVVFLFTDFLRSSRYYSSIVISINFYYVECGDGRRPRILVDNFGIPRSKTRVPLPGFTQTWQNRVNTFVFALIQTFAFFFLFRAKTTLLVLWIFTSNISPHFAEFEGDQIKDHKRKVDTNYPASRVA